MHTKFGSVEASALADAISSSLLDDGTFIGITDSEMCIEALRAYARRGRRREFMISAPAIGAYVAASFLTIAALVSDQAGVAGFYGVRHEASFEAETIPIKPEPVGVSLPLLLDADATG